VVGGAAPAGASSPTWTVSKSYPAVPGTSAIACPTTTVCYAVGGNSSGTGDILKTTASGATWTKQTLPSGTGDLFGIACPSATRCTAVGLGSVITTTDGGMASSSGHCTAAGTTRVGTLKRLEGTSQAGCAVTISWPTRCCFGWSAGRDHAIRSSPARRHLGGAGGASAAPCRVDVPRRGQAVDASTARQALR